VAKEKGALEMLKWETPAGPVKGRSCSNFVSKQGKVWESPRPLPPQSQPCGFIHGSRSGRAGWVVDGTDPMLPTHADVAGVEPFPQAPPKALLSQTQGTLHESHIG